MYPIVIGGLKVYNLGKVSNAACYQVPFPSTSERYSYRFCPDFIQILPEYAGVLLSSKLGIAVEAQFCLSVVSYYLPPFRLSMIVQRTTVSVTSCLSALRVAVPTPAPSILQTSAPIHAGYWMGETTLLYVSLNFTDTNTLLSYELVSFPSPTMQARKGSEDIGADSWFCKLSNHNYYDYYWDHVTICIGLYWIL